MAKSALKAIVFDLDGTLYDAGRMRRRMLIRLAWAYAWRPLEGWRVARILGSYRRAQETLRLAGSPHTDLEVRQLELASRATGQNHERVEACVERWMIREPHAVLPGCMDRNVHAILGCLSQHLRLAVLSDYPAEAKLEAMGIRSFFHVVVTAQDQEVQRFKPDPRGLEVALEKLGVEKHEALYVGDRPEVDGEAAVRAGVSFVLIGARNRRRAGPWPTIERFDALRDAIAG